MQDNFLNHDTLTPGRVYLCQVSPGISCGACCGLYNVADASRFAINEMLERRTEIFKKTRRDYESIFAFADEIAKTENRNRPVDNFHHCPYIGFMDTEPLSPGCLLHPLAAGNNGLDLRGASYYGGMPCHMYFCPTCHEIPERYKKAARMSADDWWIFGLFITESAVIKCFFENVELCAGKKIEPDSLKNHHAFCSAVRSFMRLKAEWPFRKDDVLANYFFKDIDGYQADMDFFDSENKWTIIFKAFRTRVSSPDDVKTAEGILEQAVIKAAEAI